MCFCISFWNNCLLELLPLEMWEAQFMVRRFCLWNNAYIFMFSNTPISLYSEGWESSLWDIFRLVHNQKKNCHLDHILLNLKGMKSKFIWLSLWDRDMGRDFRFSEILTRRIPMGGALAQAVHGFFAVGQFTVGQFAVRKNVCFG